MIRQILSLVMGSLFLLMWGMPVQAATITIDAVTAYVADDRACSLIEAIDNANADAQIHADCAAGSGADTLTLTADVLLTGDVIFSHDGATGLPSITSVMSIEGEGYSITRNSADAFRLLHIALDGDLTLNRVTIGNGLIDSGFADGGGIYNRGQLQVRESVIEGNRLEAIFPSGGGIYNVGTLLLVNTVIRNNAVAGDAFAHGGGLYNGATTGVASLINTTIENNQTQDTDLSNSDDAGGGIYNIGDLTLNNSIIRNNTADGSGGGLLTGASFNPIRFEMYNSMVADNVAGVDGGGMVVGTDNTLIFGSTIARNRVEGGNAQAGGGIRIPLNITVTMTNTLIEDNQVVDGFGGGVATSFLADVRINGSVIRGNQAFEGGGLYNVLANTRVADSLITQNTANSGGGVFDASSNFGGFTIERSAIIGNSADFIGGGFGATGNLNTSQIINSTISGNTSPTFGGGIGLNQGGQVDVLHSTVAENSSTQFINSVGGINAFAGTTTLTSNIIANNVNEDCSATSASTSGGYNITTGSGGGFPLDRWCSFIPLQPTDQLETDPLLLSLSNNGNLGVSYLLDGASPAIDAIPADCPAELNGIDQRGVPRPTGSCDVGAISDDHPVLPSVTFTTDTTIFDSEGTAPTQSVTILVDNTAGTLDQVGSLPLTVYLSAQGSAAPDVDYTDPLALPAIFTFDNATLPAPGTSTTITLPYTVIDDLLAEDDERITLQLTVVGPGVLGAITSHTITIIDDDPPIVIVDQMPTQAAAAPDVAVFDPAISKIGFLVPDDIGVTGEQLEWVVTVSNVGDVVGNNVTITDTLLDALQIDRVEAAGAQVSINGQTVTVTYPALAVGELVTFSIFTTVLDGVDITNTACISADNGGQVICSTGSFVSQLPQTGEVPFNRFLLLMSVGVMILLMLLGTVGYAVRR